ncbi:hypothetical protein A8O14_01680 [Polynucleobacter wuianus]|uniref:Oxidoreductase n=1 Tax=Polynucleobacter wuianus TaxID=1743168 RepID=A0A191UDE1_9BURK|nr:MULTISPECIES: DUF934 domain-containing protein [Polynucleobacter]ANI98915.1 hypothetical protein A8O14_01680 [Polynucleobacter wuianus]MBU3553740.1 DUF934 domain-containing protein [Polynucleobacter sp. MWH-Post4-6-1]
MSNINTIPAHEQILHFPKGQKPSLAPNEWLIWRGNNSKNEDAGTNSRLPDLDHGKKKVLVPFGWWITHHNESDIQAKAKNGQIGVWFAADEDILKHADLIKQGKAVWPLVAAHFPIFRDGRSFSTAALLRDRFNWAGEIRAIGDVLIDQLLQGARVGFDSFALRPDQKTDVALKQFDLFSVTTQNSWRGKRATLIA